MFNRKELIKEYKNQKHPAGIFAVKNKPENKMFIGKSLNLPAKIRGITFELEMGSHAYSKLAEDYKRLGKDQFEISILDQIEVKDETEKELRSELETIEEMWVEKLKSEGVTFYNKK
ncbi:MAG: GIY-YIG nuclease family protein [Ignavibacteriaceae bacterium]|nr:GIY-YIG nuclease family protein [Ignavibacteriaceae bacterium]